jgi:hypothetical protein
MKKVILIISTLTVILSHSCGYPYLRHTLSVDERTGNIFIEATINDSLMIQVNKKF